MPCPDYKKMYLTMFAACEEAVNILIAAQRECEEMYLAAAGPEEAAPPPEEVPAPASCPQI